MSSQKSIMPKKKKSYWSFWDWPFPSPPTTDKSVFENSTVTWHSWAKKGRSMLWRQKLSDIFGRHDDVFDVMTYILRIFDVMKNFLASWRTFQRHYVFLTSWRLFDVILTLWRTFWRHDKLFDVMPCFWLYEILSWRQDIFLRLKCWCYDDLFDVRTLFWRLHDVLTNFLTSWQTFWRRDEVFDVMTCFWHYDNLFWCHDILFDVMTNVSRHDVSLTYDKLSWRKDECFLRHDMFLFWRSVWRHDLFDVMAWFWRLHDVLTNSWRIDEIFWRQDKPFDEFFDVILCFWHHD